MTEPFPNLYEVKDQAASEIEDLRLQICDEADGSSKQNALVRRFIDVSRNHRALCGGTHDDAVEAYDALSRHFGFTSNATPRHHPSSPINRPGFKPQKQPEAATASVRSAADGSIMGRRG